MLGGHERDRRRARLGLRSSGASLMIRHGLARFPWDGWIGLFNLGPLARRSRTSCCSSRSSSLQWLPWTVPSSSSPAGHPRGGYGRSATSLASDLSCTAPHPSPSSTDDVNTGLRIHPREVRAPRCRTSESRALAMCFPDTHLNLRARPFYLTLTTTLPFARPFSR